jgi:hypothetical protein
MENKALKAITFVLVTIMGLAVIGITYGVMDNQPEAYLKHGEELYCVILLGLLAAMPFFTFLMRSISNSSFAWILGVIIASPAVSLYISLSGYHYGILAAVYFICCLGILIPSMSGGSARGSGCDCNCDKNCDCAMGECF